MARDRSDTRWANLEEGWQRLVWARSTHGAYRSGAAFARAAGEKEHTYKAYERGEGASKATPLDYQKTLKWADLLDVNWEWLLNGEGAPWVEDEPRTALVDELADTAAKVSPEDQELLLSMARRMAAKAG